MAKIPLGCEPVVGSLTPSKKREYRVTNRLQEGKRPIYAVVFNFIDSRYFNAFATAGGNRVCTLTPVTKKMLYFLVYRPILAVNGIFFSPFFHFSCLKVWYGFPSYFFFFFSFVLKEKDFVKLVSYFWYVLGDCIPVPRRWCYSCTPVLH